MMTGEEAELKEQSNTSESREGNSNSERRDSLELARNIHEDDEEERPCSLNSQTAVTKERRSSHSSSPGSGRDTPEPDIESSLAYKSYTKSSRKRSKRYLPPDEPNEVNEWISEEVVSPESPALLRNKLLTAVVNQAEKDRKVIKDSEALESLLVDDLNSSSSSIQIGKFDESLQKKYDDDTVFVSQNADKNCPVNNGRSASPLEDEKSTKSETSLLGCDNQQISAYKKGPKSAPGPVGVASRCTQTEWSWLEDMKRFDSLRSRLQHSTTPSDNVGQSKYPVQEPSTQSRRDSEGKKEENITERKDSEDDFFKEPTMEFSSGSSDEEDVVFNLDKESFLPSIGPPKILQYVKESVIPPFKDVCPDGNAEDKPEEYFVDHSCAFCSDEISEKVEDQQHISPEEKFEFSCPVFKEHIQQQSTYKEDEGFIRDELIDIRPHPPFGTKAARKAAKERAAERAREREIERQKVSGNAVNFYATNRQMKTLTYSLASTKYMDEGWTVRPRTPVGTESAEPLEPFDIEINSSRTQQKQTFLERYYTNGKRLLILFPDGTGCCYYPSGNPAVIISSTEKGKYSYILQEDTYEHSRLYTGILGVFDPTGHGSCYFKQSGKIRMVLTPFGGTYFDDRGEKKKKWFWYSNYGNHVHAPPFQPITFAMTKELSVRCMGQDYIIITYNHGRHTIRFNVGARLKTVGKRFKPPPSKEDYELQLREIRQFVNMVIERVQMMMRFPHSTKINKLPGPKLERKYGKSSRAGRRLIDTDDGLTVVVN